MNLPTCHPDYWTTHRYRRYVTSWFVSTRSRLFGWLPPYNRAMRRWDLWRGNIIDPSTARGQRQLAIRTTRIKESRNR